ncbi:13279_t:CDS:2 [Entrophospora sp. SA101]|nr:13279_t:CDS:2 [Entrophospora sp. SA101]
MNDFTSEACKDFARMLETPGAPNALRQRLPPPINTISTTSSSTMTRAVVYYNFWGTNANEHPYCGIFDLTKIIPNSILESSSKLTTLIDGTGWTNLEDIVKDNVEYSVDGNNENQYETIFINL